MARTSRRGFLRAASSAAAAMAIARRVPAWAVSAQAAGQVAAGPVKVWSTFRERRHAAGDPLSWKPATEIAANAIALDPAAARQEMLGFGAAMTDASCYVLSRLSDAERQPILHDLFAPEEMALNVCRTCIGASDYSRTLYSFDESPEPDPELKKFSIDHDKAYILPMLREARKANPELFLFSSPWSPPGWMKPNNSMLGGCMRKQSFDPYARYFLKFLDGYKAEGVAIDAVTVQNETDAEQEGHMPACLWAQEQEMEFVASHLGPALRKANMPTKIWVLDHNYSLWGRAIDELSDPATVRNTSTESRGMDTWASHQPCRESTMRFRKRTRIGPRAVRTLLRPTTRRTGPSGPVHSTTSSTTGRGRLRRGILRWMRRAVRTSGHSRAAA